MGGVFVPVAGKVVRPAYVYGPKDGDRSFMFQCPVSAIHPDLFALLDLWHACRLGGALPLPGAWLDQPLSVRRAFPVFEGYMRSIEQRMATTAMMTASLGMFRGGSKG